MTERERAEFIADMQNFRETMTPESAKEFREELYRCLHFDGTEEEYKELFFPKKNWKTY
ncbi:MAG: hypothetical protein LBS63_02265 [Prevotellaceae bacterium]|jgi:hypothetical protein|nr:hypothetical protein [Prevotellaceae bacterium]